MRQSSNFYNYGGGRNSAKSVYYDEREDVENPSTDRTDRRSERSSYYNPRQT